MKKIVLGVATVLLSLGLLAGCNNDDVDDKINNTGPEENEPTDEGNEGPGPEEGGTGSGIGGALPEELEGEWLLGYTSSGTNYYFNGEVESSFYGGVTTSDLDAVVVTATAVSDGATLTFEDDDGTEYICMVESDGHHNFSWSEEPFTWKYDEDYETFVTDDSEGAAYFMGNYGTQYQELRMSEYGYLTGEITSSNEQFAAHLYEVPTYVAPTSITLGGKNTVTAYELITLTATIEPKNADPSLVWSWESNESNGEVTVYDSGMVLGVAEGSVTVTATSVNYPDVSGSIVIAVTEGSNPTEYKLGAVDKTEYCYRWFTGSASGNFLASSTSWDEAADVYITKVDDGTENACALSFCVEDELKYISATSSGTSTSISDEPCVWYWNETYELFALGTTVGGTSNQDRGLAYYQSNKDIRAYATTASQLSSYTWFSAFATEPENQEKPELEEVTSLTTGDTYYLGLVEEDEETQETTFHLINGSISSNRFSTVTYFYDAVAVTVTGDDESGWTLTIDGQYVYAYISGSNSNFGLSSDETVPSEGTKTFLWDTTYNTFYTTDVKKESYTGSYFEFYNNLVALWGYSESELTDAAHLYQVVDAD